MPDIDTKLLRAFVTVAAERSFSMAAELRGCSQGTMSSRIRMLEDQLGMRLFERKRSGIQLTVAGRDLLPGVQATLDMHDRMIDRANSKLVAGSVRLGIAEGCSVDLFSKVLTQVYEHYTTLEIEITNDDSFALQQEIEAGSLDLAIVMLLEELPSAIRLSRPRLHWVTSPDFAIGDWDVLPLACYPKGSLLRAAAIEALHSRGVRYREALNSANERVIESAVACGTAIAAMVEGTVPANLKVLSNSTTLPPLGRIFVQLLQRPGPQSEAAHLVKREITSLYPGS